MDPPSDLFGPGAYNPQHASFVEEWAALPAIGVVSQHEPLRIHLRTDCSAPGASVCCPLRDSDHNEHIDQFTVYENHEDLEHEVTSAFKEDANLLLGDSSGYCDNNRVHSDSINGPFNSDNVTPAMLQQSPMHFPSHNAYMSSTLQNTGPNQPIFGTGQSQPSVQANLMCHICQTAFGRPSEYRRHMKKHGGHAFPCTWPGCSKSFYRKDKLVDHLRQGHKIISRRAQANPSTGRDSAE